MNASAVLQLLLRVGGAALVCAAFVLPSHAQERSSLVGMVIDEATLQPLPGATVTLVDTRIRARTDGQGNFIVPDVPVGTFSLRVTADGYSGAVDQVTVTSGEVGFVQVLLVPMAMLLDEVLVMAGRRDASTVSPRANSAALTAADLLQQQVPGLSTGRSGSIGAGTQVTIRGVKSFQLATRPAIYIDGVLVSDSGTQPALGGPKMAVLDDIPAADVKRIRVIKGPSAGAMFGDSANGVILIETVQGAQVR